MENFKLLRKYRDDRNWAIMVDGIMLMYTAWMITMLAGPFEQSVRGISNISYFISD